MIFRLINGAYRRTVIPLYVKSCIKQEQHYEENLVLQNIPESSLSPLSDLEKEQVRKLFGRLWGEHEIEHFSELALFKHYNGFDPRYISHYMYLPVIAHKLNNYRYTKMLEHKSLLGYLAKGVLKFPYCYVRCIDGEYFDNKMRQIGKEQAMRICLETDSIVVKDSVDSSGGESVELLRLKDISESDRREELNRIFSERKNDFVIQERIKQHPSFSRFNTTSINTLRVTSLYLNGRYSTLSIILRFGKQGMKVDNWGSGGIIIGVSEDGKLSKTGYDIQLNEYEEYNEIKFNDEYLSQVPALLKDIEEAHQTQFSLCKFIGWDICFDENNHPVVLEINSSQPGVIGEQLCTGPIFGNRTQEVIDYCSGKPFRYHKSIFQY